MNILWLLCVGLFALLSRLSEVNAQTCGSRLRKDWDMMTTTEKTTYKNAIAASMDSGAYIKFVEMHTEMMSEREAHRQCMFIYWHRLFLVAFENMLRGQGSQFACVTVPYFNWIVASARVTSGACTSLGSCMAITRELGGWTGPQLTVAINGINNSGRCANVSPLDRFCQTSSSRGTSCVRCVPRGDWSTARVPTAAGYASVRNQVLLYNTIGEMSPAVEGGCHNNIHAVLSGTMGTFASPADPIFWSHHAMVDLLHATFHKCIIGTGRLTFQQKATHTQAWSNCARRTPVVSPDIATFRPTDVIRMRTGERGVNPIDGRNDPLIGRYFNGVPSQFAGLMDIRDLGTSSYGYYISGQVATLYTQCRGSPSSRKLEEATARNSTSSHKMCGTHDDEEEEEEAYSGDGNLHPEADYHGQDDGHQDVVIVDSSGNPVTADTPTEAYVTEDSEKLVVDWYDQTIDTIGGYSDDNMADLERQACMFENVCLGGTDDYTEEFKAIWNVKEPRCKTIVDAIMNGTDSINYEGWRENMESYFGCPQPTNSTYPTNSTSSGSWSSTDEDLQEGSSDSDTIRFSDVLSDIEPAIESTWDD